MNIIIPFAALCSLAIGISSCQSQSEYCTVKGNIKGIKDGTRLELQDAFNHYNIIAKTRVRDGSFEFHPRISSPTHVVLYSQNDLQLKDFFLEPGTIIANVDATDEKDLFTGAKGTLSNDLFFQIQELKHNGDYEAANKLQDEVLLGEETGILALYFASGFGGSAAQGLVALDHLSPDIATKPYVVSLRDVLIHRAKTEPAPKGSGSENYYIDMEFPDVDGNLISLNSIVNNPINRYVILDFWATWCGPCLESIPELMVLYDTYHEKGLEIYSVSEDENEKNWKTYLQKSGMTWVNVRDIYAGRNHSKTWSDYALVGIPTILLIDGETGAILLRDNRRDLETVISHLLQ